MTIKSLITDPCTGIQAHVNDGDECNALIVATRPLKTFTNKLSFFTSDDYGINMNQNAGTGGTPEEVHDGIDSVLWTASDIIGGGKSTFNSTDQNHTAAGTKSIKNDNSPIGDVFQFAKGSDLDCNGYVSLSMWVYVDKDWKGGDSISIYGWDTDTATQIGISVQLENYFSWANYDVWHKITIPLTDMGDVDVSTTLDALRVSQDTAEGKAPKYYLDDIQFEETGTPIDYIVKPEAGTVLC